ncbi:MAG: response regulator transcription factor [Acetobacteraceae bacterium]|nr:response regulator transcription factor [Acetobacteraceae bacterium]
MAEERPILIVEDDDQVAATIAGALAREGWATETASTLAEGRALLDGTNPRVVVVDLGLPDGSGIAFVREAAARGGIGIIVVSGRGEEVDRVIGLEVGADDYIAKPFSVREMSARVRALMRRLDTRVPVPAAASTSSLPPPQTWSLGGVTLDPTRLRVVGAQGDEVRLTGGEAGMLQLLLAHPDAPLDRETIAEQVLGHRLLPQQRGVDQLASTLRKKLATASEGQLQVVAVRGRGYRLVC